MEMEQKKYSLIDKIEQGTKYNLQEFLKENENLINDPLFGPMRIRDNMNNSLEAYKESLIRRKTELELTLDEIEFITETAYIRVYKQVFEE